MVKATTVKPTNHIHKVTLLGRVSHVSGRERKISTFKKLISSKLK
jgi:hypothetical protein